MEAVFRNVMLEKEVILFVDFLVKGPVCPFLGKHQEAFCILISAKSAEMIL
ncbi:hypothetical protein [Paenibacillus sp. 481]|uniref:hypothetical protein n=1 Tax=Paenibacillus sp. 481 TaxID=2835869 RepID=UPI001E57956A|nr:hypothetical protein [Paenibacillus sp. 481]UHA73300.1 hypothetical protein KIK04_22445 [Paenibacillus sp. 481]